MPRREPIKWPNKARIVIVPCFAWETWPEDLGMPSSLNMSNRPALPTGARFKKDVSVISDRQYGERGGIFRLLDLLKSEGIRTTFFLNGMNAERFPETTREIAADGHEIASENYIHDYSYMKDYDEEKNDLIKSIDAITKVVGKRPQGYLSTGITPSDNTAPIIAEAGYTYWMDPQHEDLPYVLRVNERELVVLQYLFYMNDYTTYSVRAPRQLLEIWKDSFDYLYTEGENDPKMMIWGMHPFLIGRPYRAKILQEFIRYAKGHPKVWFARCIDIANWWLENYKDNHVEQWPNCLSMVVPPYVSKASVVPLKMKEQGLLKE